MSLNIDEIAQQMLGAAKGVVAEKWPSTQKYLESETKIFAQRLASIEQMRLAGVISESRAKLHVEFQKEAWETVLLAVEGMSQLLVEQALNAALKAVQEVVNKAVGFALL
jgi:hypothetical protein